MFCPVCGTQCADNAQNCPTCGAQLGVQPQQPVYPQPMYQQPMYQPLMPRIGMKWYNFLIYFGLWAGAFANAVLNGIVLLTGSHYDGYADLVYAVYDGLKACDVIFGLVFIGLAVLQIVTRFQLAGFKKNAPRMVTMMYLAAAVLTVANAVITMSIIGEEIEMATIVPNVAVNVAMLFVNMTYFKKREFLFVN